MQYSDAQAAEGAAPTLDLLLQPLLLQSKPRCMARLAEFVPAALPGSYGASVLASANALSAHARAAIKAEQLAKLGAPLDLLVKVSGSLGFVLLFACLLWFLPY